MAAEGCQLGWEGCRHRREHRGMPCALVRDTIPRGSGGRDHSRAGPSGPLPERVSRKIGPPPNPLDGGSLASGSPFVSDSVSDSGLEMTPSVWGEAPAAVAAGGRATGRPGSGSGTRRSSRDVRPRPRPEGSTGPRPRPGCLLGGSGRARGGRRARRGTMPTAKGRGSVPREPAGDPAGGPAGGPAAWRSAPAQGGAPLAPGPSWGCSYTGDRTGPRRVSRWVQEPRSGGSMNLPWGPLAAREP